MAKNGDGAKADRDARLKAALRANLQRRKQKARTLKSDTASTNNNQPSDQEDGEEHK